MSDLSPALPPSATGRWEDPADDTGGSFVVSLVRPGALAGNRPVTQFARRALALP
jgi:hypothetical protein